MTDESPRSVNLRPVRVDPVASFWVALTIALVALGSLLAAAILYTPGVR